MASQKPTDHNHKRKLAKFLTGDENAIEAAEFAENVIWIGALVALCQLLYYAIPPHRSLLADLARATVAAFRLFA
jgi:hypothetical protein